MLSQNNNDEASNALIKEIFYDSFGRPKRTPLFAAQLQIKLENRFFEWQVTAALTKLVTQGKLGKIEQITEYASSPVFYFPKEIITDASSLDLVKKHVLSIAKLMDKYSHPNVTHAVGKQLEGLVKYELRVQRFKIVGENTAEYKGKIWTKTGHDLDFIAEHENSSLAIGVEVKNTLGVIERQEVEVKIDICNYLGITPVFAVRWIGPHMGLIKRNDGFAWIFKTQIYPPGFEELTKEIYERLELPVIVRTELPEKPVTKFAEWVRKKLSVS